MISIQSFIKVCQFIIIFMEAIHILFHHLEAYADPFILTMGILCFILGCMLEFSLESVFHSLHVIFPLWPLQLLFFWRIWVYLFSKTRQPTQCSTPIMESLVFYQICPLLDELSFRTYKTRLPVVGYSSLPLFSDQSAASTALFDIAVWVVWYWAPQPRQGDNPGGWVLM
jgi:hypothetical protein